MSHVYESTFHEQAHQWLKNNYGDDRVHHEVYLTYEDPFDGDEKALYVDFVAEAPMTTWTIEAERGPAKVREGVGQAKQYAAAVRQAERFQSPVTPAVLVPHGHSTGQGWARPLLTVKEAPKLD